jgi:broad specificity phosphatase PhoE
MIDNRLIEQNYGIYEGVDRSNIGFQNNKKLFAFKYPGGESMMQVAYRVYGLLESIKEQYPDKNVLLVCHGGVCRIINTYFEDITNEEFYHWSMENTQLREYCL